MKTKRILSIILTLCMVLTMFPVSTLATEDAPVLVDGYYEIYTADQLYWFAEQVNSGNTSINGKLMNDIVVNENVLKEDGSLNGDGSHFKVWAPIGNNVKKYTGTFDGNGKTVSGLYFNDTKRSYVGLFGYVYEGTVQNVGVVGSYLNGRNYVGGVVGYNYGGYDGDGEVSNCYNSGSVSGSVSGSDYVGGVVGYNDYYSTVSNSYNTGSVSGEDNVGGVVGYNDDGTASNSYNTGSVSGRGDKVGGVVGINSGYSKGNYEVSNCYNTGSVSGGGSVGGVVGCNYSNYHGSCKVSNSYNSGSVSGTGNNVGGMVGYSYYGTVSNSYNTGSVSGNGRVGGVVGYNDDGTASNSYNTGSISGTEYVGGVVGYNDWGTVSNCYYLSSCVTSDNRHGTSKAAEQFVSGEVAYLLGEAYGQTIGTEMYPVFGGAVVYRNQICGYIENDTYEYSNTLGALGHSYVDGFCLVCDAYEPAMLNGDYFEIINVGQLYWFAEQVNSNKTLNKTVINGKLMADIVVNENVLNEDGTPNGDGSNFNAWTPIGNNEKKYSGTFDGNGKTVSGLYINDSKRNYVGFFGYVYNGCVQNVGVEDSYINGSQYVGGVVGYSRSTGTVSNCYNTGSIIGFEYVGGVVGYTEGTVCNSYNTGSVSGDGRVGGVVGYNSGNYDHGTVSNSYNTGSVSGGSSVGGVVGYNYYNGSVSNCYNTGSVNGDGYVGGVVGSNDDSAYDDYDYRGTICDCYNTGSVSGTGYYVGGVVGYSHAIGTVSNCYNTGSVSGYNNVGGVVGDNSGGYDGDSEVSNCYNSGSVSGEENVGGVVGDNTGTVSNSYNTGSVSGYNNVGGVVGWNGGYYYGTLTCCFNTGIIIGNYDVGGVVGNRYDGTISNSYYLSGCVTSDNRYGTIMSAEQFASGEVCWLLSGSPMPAKGVKNADENPWGQKIGKDSYPVFSDDKVIPVVDNGGNVVGYRNEVTGVCVSGTVTSYLDGDTTVELVQNGEVAYSITVSGSEYAIEGVVAGDYTLRVTKANHAPMEFAITVGDEPATFDATICPVGDVTGDGVVNIKDFQRLLRHVNKTNPLTDYELACGDVTGDGVCNIKDFQRLLRHVNKTNPLF